MRVAEWIAYDDAQNKTEGVRSMGGWFGHNFETKSWDEPHRWTDYVARFRDDEVPYLEAIKADVLASGRFLCGNQHQNDEQGVPLFDDGTVGIFSFRGWGDLMAAIATERDGANHNYMEFYYS